MSETTVASPDRRRGIGAVRAAAALLALLGSGPGTAGEDPLEVSSRREGESVVIEGVNRHGWVPYHAVIRFPRLENYRSSVTLPARVVVPPSTRRTLLTLTRRDGGKSAAYRMTTVSGFGDPSAEPDRTVLYLLPFAHGTKRLVGQGYLGTFTHRNSYSLDFNMEVGTAVHAARAGVVFRVKDDSNEGGVGPEYDDKANVVSVLHEDGTWAEYAHLRRGGARVKPGDRVVAGEVIGESGNTGRSAGPHLHFAVSRATWEGPATLPTAFRGAEGRAVTIEEGRWFYAYHPGGGPFDAVLGSELDERELKTHREPVPFTGKVEVRAEQIDNTVLLYCRNGTRASRSVSIGFEELVNFVPSRKLPRTIVVPGLTEVYALKLDRMPSGGRSSYQLRYSSRPARSTAR